MGLVIRILAEESAAECGRCTVLVRSIGSAAVCVGCRWADAGQYLSSKEYYSIHKDATKIVGQQARVKTPPAFESLSSQLKHMRQVSYNGSYLGARDSKCCTTGGPCNC